MYDSAMTLQRVLARFLNGEDAPFMAQAPRPAEAFVHPFLRVIDRMPRRFRQGLMGWGGVPMAVSPATLARSSAEDVAGALVGRLPPHRCPAVVVGATNGAGVHLAAALGVPWLPQTVMLPVRTLGTNPDEPQQAMDRLAGPIRAFLGRNPGVTVYHQHDPAHDRVPVSRIAYLRIRWTTLPGPYRRWLAEALEPGARILVLDCVHRRPTTRIGDRHIFQFGGLDALTMQDYFDGSARVEEFLARQGARRRRWDPPAPDGDRSEAEWGFDADLLHDVEAVAESSGATVQVLRYDHPQDLSPVVADVHRGWFERRGLPTGRLLVDQFLLADPWATLRAGAVPYWTLFGTEVARQRALDYLTRPYDEVFLTLFSNGVDVPGDADGTAWAEVLQRARRHGAFVGTDPAVFPVDLRTVAGFHHDLVRLPGRQPVPRSLTLAEFDDLTRSTPHPGVEITDPR